MLGNVKICDECTDLDSPNEEATDTISELCSSSEDPFDVASVERGACVE